ncbi:hypothetical protein [Streptomyces sp. NEAU-S7GS2]|uniref:hypothetical protein n=1 Tax=Streptomyces sp. NEAU-S7GS2 TaxID=2202000 RepID=UPI0019513D80|nr:hypothetical protein [Streptomyces sp. NEAU-S7GS2]
MRADIAWWDLDGTAQTVDSLTAHLRGGAAAWDRVPGLLGKVWIADRRTNRWGAVMLWADQRPALAELPANHAARLLGGPPTHRDGFDIEAVAGGAFAPARVAPAAGGTPVKPSASAVAPPPLPDAGPAPAHRPPYPGSPRHA